LYHPSCNNSRAATFLVWSVRYREGLQHLKSCVHLGHTQCQLPPKLSDRMAQSPVQPPNETSASDDAISASSTMVACFGAHALGLASSCVAEPPELSATGLVVGMSGVLPGILLTVPICAGDVSSHSAGMCWKGPACASTRETEAACPAAWRIFHSQCPSAALQT
jgi:hypothetical protein